MTTWDEGGADGFAEPASGPEQPREKRQQVTAKVAEVREKVVGSMPQPARQSLDRVQQQAKERPVPAAFLGGLATGWLIGRRKKK